MVLRKHIPPRLSNSSKGNDRLDSSTTSSPATPSTTDTTTTPTTVNTPSSSPKRLTRRRAPSSPLPRRSPKSPPSPRVPSQESIFSPDLNTSPAFDLMPLEQAQRSPAGISSDDSKNPWAEDSQESSAHGGDGIRDHSEHVDMTPDKHASGSSDGTPQEDDKAGGKTPTRVPSILVAGTQRRMAANEWKPIHPTEDASAWDQSQDPPYVQLQSNNPFIKDRQSEPEVNPWDNAQNLHGSDWGSNANARDSRTTQLSGNLSQSEGFIPMTARLSLLDRPPSESPWHEERSNSAAPMSSFAPRTSQDYAPQPPLDTATDEVPVGIYMGDGPASGDLPTNPWMPQPPAATPEMHHSTADSGGYDYAHQEPQQPVDRARHSFDTGVSPAITVSSAAKDSNQDLIELDDPAKPKTNTLYRPPSSVYDSDVNASRVSTNSGQAPSSAIPPPLPHRDNFPRTEESSPLPSAPIAPLTETEMLRQQEQRAETYSIRHINWTDTTGKLRMSPILIQNKNGPCPLLALVNSLVISAGRDEPLPIVKALQTREHISLGLLIEALFDELTTCLGPDNEIPDIEALSRFLTMLHTGMNVNPRLTLESGDSVGSFLQTSDIRLYSTFGIPLIHGWLAPPSSVAHGALVRVARYHEDIQLLQFQKDEIENRVLRGEEVTEEQERLIQDIDTIQQFVDVENATQLSVFGLEQLQKELAPGSVSILFRNDHFSTIYKHPKSHGLFTIVTDAGYASHAEIVWESLVDVKGANAELFSGDFRPVGHSPWETTGSTSPQIPSSNNHTADSGARTNEEPLQTTLSPQEQADADYAYALSLQFQEEERREASRRNNSNNNINNNSNNNNSRSQQARNRSASTPYRPEQNRTARNAPNRFSTSRLGQSHHQQPHGKITDYEPPPPYEQAAGMRQHSQLHATPYSSSHQAPPVTRRPPGPAPHPSYSDRARDKNKDCVVM